MVQPSSFRTVSPPSVLVGLSAACLLLGAACAAPEPPSPEPPSPEPTALDLREAQAAASVAAGPIFQEAGRDSGFAFHHFNGRTGELLLAEITCGGGALFDADGDGDLDAYLLQGHLLGPGKTMEDALDRPRYPEPLTDRLFLNEGTEGGRLRFRDATGGLGAETTSYGCAVAVGDADGDGLPDLYLANLGRDQLLRNRGGGRFEDVTEAAGLGGPGNAGSGVVATFFDFDADGWLDLFVGNNMAFDLTGQVVCRSLTGAKDYCGPGAYPSQPDRLFRGVGGGRFEDVTVASGLASAPAVPTLGAVAADFDGDGRTDLYVANDGQPNNLWINQGDGTFEDRALLGGSAVNGSGEAEASMGVDAGDYDGDGDLDLVLSHLVKETNTLYRNDGSAAFSDVSASSGLGPPSLPMTGFGAGWLDYDLDGWLDLLVVNGAVTLVPAQVQAGDSFPLRQANQLFRHLGPGSGHGRTGGPRFEDVSGSAGPAFAALEVSRGAAFGDVDGDGDEDVLVVNNGGPARLLLNQVGQQARWLGVRLITGDPPRDSPGATAELLRQDDRPIFRRVRVDGSYGSASDPRIVFGLGAAPAAPADAGKGAVTGVLVTWPGGEKELFPPPPEGVYTTLHRGQGSEPPS